MLTRPLSEILKFYFITDHATDQRSITDQVSAAVLGGATIVQYRNKAFSPRFYSELLSIRDLCKSNQVPFIINDDIILARAVSADGVHLGQSDHPAHLARKILGPDALIGISVSTPAELAKTDLTGCDYMGTGPVFQTGTKPDANPVVGLDGLRTMVRSSRIPVVAIGGIDSKNAQSCFLHGASGVAVITAVSRAQDPLFAAKQLAAACDSPSRPILVRPWSDEFALIDKLLSRATGSLKTPSRMIIPPGDDTAILFSLSSPVITTDTQRQGVHFSFTWQTPEEIGEKAVEITLSDLASAYAEPVCVFVNLGIPQFLSDNILEAIYKGMGNRLAAYNCELGGGNISGADQLSLDLFALGEGKKNLIPLRSNARPGYGVYCTGPLGAARAGIELLKKKRDDFPGLVRKFISPRARFDAAGILAEHEVDCVLDISDGLAGDAAHMAKASGVSILLEIDSRHLFPELVAYCDSDRDKALEMALSGGEDYELLFSCAPEKFDRIQKQLPEIYPVGKWLEFSGKSILNPPEAFSLQHGRKP